MRRTLVFALLLCDAFAALQSSAAFAGRTATDITPVLPARNTFLQLAQPDSAPTPDSLTFLETVGICGTPTCDASHPICADESLFVTLGGHLPDNCHSIRAIRLYYPPIVTIRPFAPWVVVYVDNGNCLDQVCVRGRFPWSGGIVMPPLTEGPYSLDVAVVTVGCGDSLPPPQAITRSMPFIVGNCDSVPPHATCLNSNWVHASGFDGCDATISPGGEAKVTFGVNAPVPLSGLQGEFNVYPSTLRITAFEVTGEAYGFRFGWTPTATGARWFLFSDGGGRIHPDTTLRPVFIVTLGAPGGAPVPAVTQITANNLLGSDPNGNAVPECPYRSLPRFARICGTSDCDANSDGHADVRDLVLMVNCLRLETRCSAVYDCNRDGSFALDDILCCAWRILRVGPCTTPGGCGPDSTADTPPKKDRLVRVSTGVATEKDGEVRVPIRIEGVDHVGAARLAMRYPSDRWRVVGVESNDGSWLTLAGDVQGEAIVGVIRIGGGPNRRALDLQLRLAPTDGHASGGELGALSADVSGNDGVRVIASLAAPARPLPGGATVELSENRPDPFTGETRFTLSLPTAASVELGVFDLGGRRVATLHRGTLQAGVSEFAWNGRSDSGPRVGAGVYFYRAVTADRSISKRMVYLGGR